MCNTVKEREREGGGRRDLMCIIKCTIIIFPFFSKDVVAHAVELYIPFANLELMKLSKSSEPILPPTQFQLTASPNLNHRAGL